MVEKWGSQGALQQVLEDASTACLGRSLHLPFSVGMAGAGVLPQPGAYNIQAFKLFAALCLAQWYSEMLVRHANQVLCAAADVFEGSPVRLNMRLPGCYWWYNTASHAAELVAVSAPPGFVVLASGLCWGFSAGSLHPAGLVAYSCHLASPLQNIWQGQHTCDLLCFYPPRATTTPRTAMATCPSRAWQRITGWACTS